MTHAVTRALFGRAGDAVAREQAREGHAEGPGRAELGGRAGGRAASSTGWVGSTVFPSFWLGPQVCCTGKHGAERFLSVGRRSLGFRGKRKGHDARVTLLLTGFAGI